MTGITEVVDLEFEAGVETTHSITSWTDESGSEVDLEGATGAMHFKTDYDDIPIVSLSTGEGGGMVITQDPRQFTFTVSGPNSRLLGGDRQTKGVYDMLVFIGGVPCKPIRGRWRCNPLATRI